MFGVRHARTPPAEMITYILHLLLSVVRSAIMYITMPGFFFASISIEVMQMHVYRHFQCSDFIHVMNVCRMKRNMSDGYKRQGEVQRVSGFMHEDNYDTTLRKAVALLLDKVANYNKCHLIMAGGRVLNLPLLSKERPWSHTLVLVLRIAYLSATESPVRLHVNSALICPYDITKHVI